MSDEPTPEGKRFATFERRDEFVSLQNTLLAYNLTTEPTREENSTEFDVLRRLSMMVCMLVDNVSWHKQSNIGQLGEYQEQSYLLDPYLEDLVVPVAECLRTHARACTSNPPITSSMTRVGRLADLLYNYIKFRGYKTISQ